MKSILLSIKPEWLEKILNKTKTIEVRKLFPKDYVGWVYLYCSKSKPYLTRETAAFIYGYDNEPLNGKVVARFWCDKVEKITVTFERTQMGYLGFGLWANYFTITADQDYLMSKSNLGYYELDNYLNKKRGFAIHISKLEIFDKPKELKHFYYNKLFHRSEPDEEGRKTFKALIQLNKAPQNYCWVEDDKR